MKLLLGTRYWNCGNIAIAIVAVRGEAGDWAAYIGATTDTSKDIIAFDIAAREGCKLSRDEAEFFFPYLDKSEYRD